jgi:hypothetical protein
VPAGTQRGVAPSSRSQPDQVLPHAPGSRGRRGRGRDRLSDSIDAHAWTFRATGWSTRQYVVTTEGPRRRSRPPRADGPAEPKEPFQGQFVRSASRPGGSTTCGTHTRRPRSVPAFRSGSQEALGHTSMATPAPVFAHVLPAPRRRPQRSSTRRWPRLGKFGSEGRSSRRGD